jgi:hypothetical protein
MKRTRELKHRLERNWDRGMDERLRAVHQTFGRGDAFIVFGFGALLFALFAMLGILIWG